ncbi:MAG TPA: hypothetical protein VLA28_12015 [Afifellaceae bacterium]|nr:hypothetical protein [Afifellaceae bacterium]
MKGARAGTAGRAGARRLPETLRRLLAWAIAVAAFALLFAMLATTAPAQTQTQCGSRTRIVAVLAGKYGEAPKAIGSVSMQRFMEVYVSDTGSWTILMTDANNYSCIIAAGSDWEDVPFEPGARS